MIRIAKLKLLPAYSVSVRRLTNVVAPAPYGIVAAPNVPAPVNIDATVPFVASRKWADARAGYAFKLGDKGSGYYKEVVVEIMP